MATRTSRPLVAAAPGGAPPPRIEYDAPLKPEMNRQERVAFTVYSVMGAAIIAFLAATLLLWWLGT